MGATTSGPRSPPRTLPHTPTGSNSSSSGGEEETSALLAPALEGAGVGCCVLCRHGKGSGGRAGQ